MGAEDFSRFVEQGIPGFYFSLGGADPEKYAQANAAGTTLPSNHSPLYSCQFSVNDMSGFQPLR
jgi:hypothetical protein